MSTRNTLATDRLVDAFPALQRLGGGRAPGRVPVVRQMTEAECGAACLAMILAFYGKAVRIEALRGSLGGGREGTTALSILTAARHHGRGRGVKVKSRSEIPPGRVHSPLGLQPTLWSSSVSAHAECTHVASGFTDGGRL